MQCNAPMHFSKRVTKVFRAFLKYMQLKRRTETFEVLLYSIDHKISCEPTYEFYKFLLYPQIISRAALNVSHHQLLHESGSAWWSRSQQKKKPFSSLAKNHSQFLGHYSVFESQIRFLLPKINHASSFTSSQNISLLSDKYFLDIPKSVRIPLNHLSAGVLACSGCRIDKQML